jgi:hypothetical protein
VHDCIDEGQVDLFRAFALKALWSHCNRNGWLLN